MDPLLSATIEVTLNKLLAVTAEEINLVWGFKEDLNNFNKSLQMIQDVLEDAERRQIDDRAVRRWLKDLEDVAFDADNVLDEIKYERLRRKIEIQNQIKRKGCFLNASLCSPLVFRWRMAHKIKDVNARLKKINEEAARHSFAKRTADAAIHRPEVIETTSITVDPVFVGRENDVADLVKLITSPINDVLSILPIVGMGGIGKTTLAREIFKNLQIEKHFEKRIWVCVSENFDVVKLLKRIMELVEGTCHGESKQAIVEKIKEKLKDKRYLLVLDDLWNEEQKYWDDFKNTLLGATSSKGNAIIITTRNQKVASIANLRTQHGLEKLSDDDCWSIIKAKAFEGGEVPQEFHNVGMDIAFQCRGSPLAANMMGGVLRGKELAVWNSIREKGPSKFEDDKNSVQQVLKISFDRLPTSSLKQCFAYCSIFPKDTEIKRERLIQMWMAEGFLPDNPDIDMETMGNRNFKILLQNSFFQEVEEDYIGVIVACKMHDLVHDLACSVSESRSYTLLGDHDGDDIPQVRYLTVLERQGGLEISKEKMSQVRTMISECSAPGKNLQDFNHLRALLLEEADEDCLASIAELVHLRFAYLSIKNMTRLPDSICKLYSLQTLYINSFDLEQLPEKSHDLTGLRHLWFPSDNDFPMPPKIGKLSCLRTLPFFKVGNKKGCRIEELGHLKNLRGQLEIRNLELVNCKTEAEKAALGGKPNLYKLKFSWSYPNEGPECVEKSNIDDESVLDGLQPHSNLKILEIEGFRGKKFPTWTMKMLKLDNLIEISFKNCHTCEEVPMLGHLSHLKYLRLKNLTNVKVIGPSFYGVVDCSSTIKDENGQPREVSFRSLESLKIQGMQNLTEWAEVQPSTIQVFPCLEHLRIKGCIKLQSAPNHFPSLKKLEFYKVDSDLPLAKILSSGNSTSLEGLTIRHVSGLTCLPSDLFFINKKLTSFSLWGCPNLTCIPQLRAYGSSLKWLFIEDCENLTELPDDLCSLESLEVLMIYNCKRLESIPNPISTGRDSGLCSIQSFSIYGCDRLSSLPITEMLKSSTSLQILRVLSCYKLTSFPRLGQLIGCYDSLRDLQIGSFSMEFTSFQDIFDNIQCFKSLEDLDLYGTENWNSLPYQIQHLTWLKYMGIYDFGIEALPDWLGNLSSLQELRVTSCPKLRHLPSQQAMRPLSKLKQVDISSCEQLEEEWPNVRCIKH